MTAKTHATNRDRHADLGRRCGWTVSSMPVLPTVPGGLTSLVMVRGPLKLGIGYTVCLTRDGATTRVHRIHLTGDGRDRYHTPVSKMVEALIVDHSVAPTRSAPARASG